MEQIIRQAIESTKEEIKGCPNKILSESDFERMLAKHLEDVLSKNHSDLSVHTQISYYEESGNSSPKYRVDILLIKDSEIEECKHNHKGFIYSGESYVFELKYLHENDSANVVRLDMEKSKLLTGNNAVLYVIVLLEKKDSDKEERIKRMWEDTLNELEEPNKNKLKYDVLYKSE